MPEQTCEPTVQRWGARQPLKIASEHLQVVRLSLGSLLLQPPEPLSIGITKKRDPHPPPVVDWLQKASHKVQGVPAFCQFAFQQSTHSAVPENHLCRTSGSFNLLTWEFLLISGNVDISKHALKGRQGSFAGISSIVP